MSADARRDSSRPLSRASIWKKYGFAWVTGLFFVVSLAAHWALAWGTYTSEQRLHGEEPRLGDYLLEVGRDTFENWQSEFLQLIWQVAGLAMLLNVGSPQSREEDDRMEEKLDAILRAVTPEQADRLIAELDDRFDRGHPSA